MALNFVQGDKYGSISTFLHAEIQFEQEHLFSVVWFAFLFQNQVSKDVRVYFSGVQLEFREIGSNRHSIIVQDYFGYLHFLFVCLFIFFVVVVPYEFENSSFKGCKNCFRVWWELDDVCRLLLVRLTFSL